MRISTRKLTLNEFLCDRGVTDYAQDTGIYSNCPIDLTPVQSGPANRADRQALDCWQPAKVGQSETREIRGLIEV